jgi:hypothetical protein
MSITPETIASISDLHHKAMSHADLAFQARRDGKEHEANNLFRQAFEAEAAAVEAVLNAGMEEPTRSVLCRSAATLAMDRAEYREAERLVASGLSGNPPEEIADELRDLFEEINAARRAYSTQTSTDSSGMYWDARARDDEVPDRHENRRYDRKHPRQPAR